jgi:hypothetical protein
MATYLAGIPVFTIMLLGRYSSDSKMKQKEEFFTVPSESNIPGNPNHNPNKAKKHNNGLYFRDAIRPLIKSFY